MPQSSNITIGITVDNLDEYVIALLEAELLLAETEAHEAEISLWSAQDKAAALMNKIRDIKGIEVEITRPFVSTDMEFVSYQPVQPYAADEHGASCYFSSEKDQEARRYWCDLKDNLDPPIINVTDHEVCDYMRQHPEVTYSLAHTQVLHSLIFHSLQSSHRGSPVK